MNSSELRRMQNNARDNAMIWLMLVPLSFWHGPWEITWLDCLYIFGLLVAILVLFAFLAYRREHREEEEAIELAKSYAPVMEQPLYRGEQTS